MSMFTNARNFSVNQAVLNNIGGNYIAHQQIGNDASIETLLSANFGDEHYYASRHEQNKRRTTDGTCRWLLDDPTFINWRDNRDSVHSILYVHGPPGSGKSTLCSQAIESIANAPTDPLVAYHFCDHAQPFKEIEILSMIACQLLERHSLAFGDGPPIPPSMLASARSGSKRTSYIEGIIRGLVCRPLASPSYFLLDGLDEELARWNDAMCNVLDFIVKLAVEYPHTVRLWITTQPRTEIRSRTTSSHCREIDLTPYARRDIQLYLLKEVPRIKGPGESDLLVIAGHLQETAETSFIWARLMLEEIQKKTSLSAIQRFIHEGFPQNLSAYYQRLFDQCPQHLRLLASIVFSLLVFARRPLRLNELWEAVWAVTSRNKKVLDPADKPYEAHLMEVFEPFVECVPNTHADSEEMSQYTCRLVHSTLKDFLLTHLTVPFIERDEESPKVYVCPEVPANACLAYLSQSRFASLLKKKENAWVDANDTPVLRNRFLIYSAKYWDRHLDDVGSPERQAALLPSVLSLIRSTNFWTLVQVQTIWVQAYYSKLLNAVYIDDNGDEDGQRATHIRKIFPWWFPRTEEGFEIWKQYRVFLRHWRYFLCGGMSDDGVVHYTGQLHHIWTGSLGVGHVLQGGESSVRSFALAAEAHDDPPCMFLTSQVTDAGTMMVIARISVTDLPPDESESPALEMMMGLGRLKCEIQTWQLGDGSMPIIQNQQTLRVAANTCDIHLYISKPTEPYPGGDKAPLAALSSNGTVLRIGTRIFTKDGSGTYHSLKGLRRELSRKANYVEETSLWGTHLAVASRTKLSAKDIDQHLDYLHEDSDDEMNEVSDWHEDTGITGLEGKIVGDDGEMEYAMDSDHDSDVVVSDDDSVSEGSSLCSDDELFQDDAQTPWAYYHHAEYSSDDDEEGGYQRPADAGPSMYGEIDSSDSEEEEDTKEPTTFGKHFSKDDDIDEWEGLPQYLSDGKPSYSRPQSTLSVFKVEDKDDPRLVFQKAFPRRRKIYCSPPVFHPTKPLLVWPLGDNEILFVDYQKRKSFTLRLRPSTTYTCHVSIQCTFSASGSHMHIAALEGRKPETRPTLSEDPEEDGDKSDPRPPAPPLPIHLAMLVSTYRLSEKKTTRSPPTLIHRVRIDLGSAKSLNTKNLPYNLTWSADYLYVTQSWKLLRVWRIPLFRSKAGADCPEAIDEDAGADDSQPVMSAEKTVFMPQTCKNRSVRFFPGAQTGAASAPSPQSARPDDTTGNGGSMPSTLAECDTNMGPGKIVVGHEAVYLPIPAGKPEIEPENLWCTTRRLNVDWTRKTLVFESPLVCYVEGNHLGSWVDSRARTKITKNRGVGMLDRVEGMEKFNPDDDCELEAYFY